MDVSNINFDSLDDFLIVIKLLPKEMKIIFLAIVGAYLEDALSLNEATKLTHDLFESIQSVR